MQDIDVAGELSEATSESIFFRPVSRLSTDHPFLAGRVEAGSLAIRVSAELAIQFGELARGLQQEGLGAVDEFLRRG